MPVTLDDMMASLSASDRAEVEQGAAAIVTQNRSLRELRKSLGVTQEDLARALETSQANVSKLEARSDLMVSTIAKAVTALGGSLHLVVSLPGRQPTTLDLGWPREDDMPSPATRALRAKPSGSKPRTTPPA